MAIRYFCTLFERSRVKILNKMNEIIEFIKKTPKTELHLHIEGTLEPDLLFKLAKRNNVKIPFKNVKEV